MWGAVMNFMIVVCGYIDWQVWWSLIRYDRCLGISAVWWCCTRLKDLSTCSLRGDYKICIVRLGLSCYNLKLLCIVSINSQCRWPGTVRVTIYICMFVLIFVTIVSLCVLQEDLLFLLLSPFPILFPYITLYCSHC